MTPKQTLERFGPREAVEYDVVVGAGPAGLSDGARSFSVFEALGRKAGHYVLQVAASAL